MENLGVCDNCNASFSESYIGKTCPICKKGKIVSSDELVEEEVGFLSPHYNEQRIKENLGSQLIFFYIGLLGFLGLETFVIWFLLVMGVPSFERLKDNNLSLSIFIAFLPILIFILLYKIYSRDPQYPTIIDLKEQNRKLGAFAIISLIALVFTLVILVLSFLLIDFDNYYGLSIDHDKLPFAIGFLVILGLVLYFKVFRFNALSYLKKIGASPLSDDLFIVNEVRTLSLRIGVSDVYVYMFPEDSPNAFAMDDGRHRVVGLSSGLVKWWNLSAAKKIRREDRITLPELQGIIAHELGHLTNKDARITSYISALISITGIATTAIVIVLVLALIFGDEEGKGEGMVGAVIRGGIGLYIAGIVFSMSFFRQREYLADLTGGELISNPSALADALSKLRSYKPKTVKSVILRAMYQADPEGFDRKKRPSLAERLFSTHPPIDKRIERLRAAAHEKKL